MLNRFELWLQGIEIEGYRRRESRQTRNDKEIYLNPNSASQRAHGTARGFFTHNRMWLPRSGKKSVGRSMVKRNDVNYAIFKVDPDSNLVVQDYSQFARAH
jgi:hypothetical protein